MTKSNLHLTNSRPNRINSNLCPTSSNKNSTKQVQAPYRLELELVEWSFDLVEWIFDFVALNLLEGDLNAGALSLLKAI